MSIPTTSIESDERIPSNVVPFGPRRIHPRALNVHPAAARAVQARRFGRNEVEHEPAEQRLARRLERVLRALLYHALLEPGDVQDSASLDVDQRVSRLASHDRLQAVARAAITLGMTADLARLAAAVIIFELQAQARWRKKARRIFSAHHRQIRCDTLAIARLLASDLETLTVRPIDRFAKYC